MTPYTLFGKITEFGVIQEPKFPDLGTFQIRKIQTVRGDC